MARASGPAGEHGGGHGGAGDVQLGPRLDVALTAVPGRQGKFSLVQFRFILGSVRSGPVRFVSLRFVSLRSHPSTEWRPPRKWPYFVVDVCFEGRRDHFFKAKCSMQDQTATVASLHGADGHALRVVKNLKTHLFLCRLDVTLGG